MQKLPKVTEERIAVAADRFIQPLIHRSKIEFSIEAAHVHGEPITWEEASKLEYKPFNIGDEWGARWDTTWFKFNATVPADWAGEEVVALISLSFGDYHEGFGREGIVWIDGKPITAVNRKREAVPLLEKANGGETIEFYVEAAANPSAQMFWGDGDLLMPDYHGKPLFQLKNAQLSTRDEQAYQLYMDFTSANSAMRLLPENQPRRGQLRRALNHACQILDLGNPDCIAPAREALKEVLAKQNGDTTHKITAVGHAHIDTAWVWPLRETVRKCARTFSTALRNMEKYPDFKFVCSQPVQYLWMKEYYPSIYEDIKAAVKRGQWEIVGSMWIEADCNITSGESLVRQLIHGKNFFQEEFGIETKDLWLPDVFGYAAALPQILRKSGVDWFLTQKISWSDTNKFPHHTFNWEGLDGTSIFTHFPPVDTYNCELQAEEINRSQVNFNDNDRATRALIPFGHGDGGGGPTSEQIERARRWENFEGLPQVEMGTVLDFFAKAKEDAVDPPVWKGELYLELHRGTLTSQAYTKMMNRRCELLLRDAEMLQVIAAQLGCKELITEDPATENVPVYDVAGHISEKTTVTDQALDRAWKILLLNQFHDIIPGSSIHWVYEDCKIDYPNVEKIALAVREAGMKKLAENVDTSAVENPVVVFNSLSHSREEIVELPSGDLQFVNAPSCGHTVVSASGSALPESISPVSASASDGSIELNNGLVKLNINQDGLITSFYDLENEREVILEGEVGNLFQIHKDYPNRWNAWDVDFFYKESVENLTENGTVELVSQSDLRAVVRITRTFSKSKVSQDVIINAGSRRVDFQTEVDWQESDRLLKVAFPVDVASYRASYEIQYGHVERSTHDNTSWDVAKFEVPAHKWADLSESDYGVSLLNNCKYAYDIDGSVMRLTLLKAANAPDPVADKGTHHFTYSLFPHAGSLQEGGVIEEAYALNVPLITQETDQHTGSLGAEKSYFAVDRPGVFIEAVKKAEKSDDVIMRFYEGYQSRGNVRVSANLSDSAQISEVDMLERNPVPLESNNGSTEMKIKPFEIKTIQIS